MEGFQGAILGVKLRHLEAWTEARRRVVGMYNDLLNDCEVESTKEMPWARHVYHVYTLRVKDRDGLQAALQPARESGSGDPLSGASTLGDRPILIWGMPEDHFRNRRRPQEK